MNDVVLKIIEEAREGEHKYKDWTSSALKRQLAYLAKDEEFRKTVEFFVDLGHESLGSIIKHIGGLALDWSQNPYAVGIGLSGFAFSQLEVLGLGRNDGEWGELVWVFCDWVLDLGKEIKELKNAEAPEVGAELKANKAERALYRRTLSWIYTELTTLCHKPVDEQNKIKSKISCEIEDVLGYKSRYAREGKLSS